MNNISFLLEENTDNSNITIIDLIKDVDNMTDINNSVNFDDFCIILLL